MIAPMAGTRPGRALWGNPHGAFLILPLRYAMQQLLQVWQLRSHSQQLFTMQALYLH